MSPPTSSTEGVATPFVRHSEPFLQEKLTVAAAGFMTETQRFQSMWQQHL
jgi:hypothetical protein